MNLSLLCDSCFSSILSMVKDDLKPQTHKCVKKKVGAALQKFGFNCSIAESDNLTLLHTLPMVRRSIEERDG